MTVVSEDGYLIRKFRYGKKKTRLGVWCDWFLVKHKRGNTGYVCISTITLPPEYIGKKIKFKIEVVEGGRP